MRRILHVDMDAFFAAIELRRRPELRELPVIIGGHGDPHERGVVSTASYEARKFGVGSGMPLRTAWRLCPQAVFLPVDFAIYEQVSGEIKALLREFSPVMEDAGIDEAFLDVSELPESPLDVAMAIKQRIRAATGLSCSIGIGPNKLLAKLASDMEKPDGLTLLTEADVATRVWPLPVRRLWGVGPKTEQRLAALGVSTIGELAALSVATLQTEFGPAHAEYLHRAAHGIDDSPLITHWEPKSLSHETTFQRDTGDWTVLRQTLARLTRELAARLRADGYRCRQVAVKLRYSDFATHTHALTLPAATDDAEVIREAALQCLGKFALIKKVRLIGLRLGALTREAAEK